MRHRRHRRVTVDLDDEIMGSFACGTPAPYVTETYEGWSGSNRRSDARENLLHLVVTGW
jgi:hypothetical protein